MINESKRQKIEELARNFNLRLLLFFGSRVKGKLHKESDYDIGYLSSRDLSFEEEGHLINKLIKILEVSDERLINLVNIRYATPFLLKEIFEEHQILFKEDGEIYDVYKIYSLKKYLDSRRLFDLRDSLIKRYFAERRK